MVCSLFLSFFASALDPITSPVFLKFGFSTILEFDEPPSEVVLGDQDLFQTERLKRSIVIKPLAENASTNLFVYFKNKDPKHFLLSASPDAEPTFFRRIMPIVPPTAPVQIAPMKKIKQFREIKLRSLKSDLKGDYLTVDFEISADASTKISPRWKAIHIESEGRSLTPTKIWSERQEVQKDSRVKARAIFAKPDISASTKNGILRLPLIDGTSMSLSLKEGIR